MNVHEYITAPNDTVHLVRQSDTFRTRCGLAVSNAWAPGDETVSGIAATCGRCRQIAGVTR
jgi:hypothetical protein